MCLGRRNGQLDLLVNTITPPKHHSPAPVFALPRALCAGQLVYLPPFWGYALVPCSLQHGGIQLHGDWGPDTAPLLFQSPVREILRGAVAAEPRPTSVCRATRCPQSNELQTGTSVPLRAHTGSANQVASRAAC